MSAEPSCGSKILIFIKTKPILFTLISVGVVVVIEFVITLPIVLSKKVLRSSLSIIKLKYLMKMITCQNIMMLFLLVMKKFLIFFDI